MPTNEDLMIMQALPLDIKVAKTKQRIKEFYRELGGQVYVSFSGGKDSTVLLDILNGCVELGEEREDICDMIKEWTRGRM